MTFSCYRMPKNRAVKIKFVIFSRGSKIPRKFRINLGNTFHVLPKPVKFRIKSCYRYELFYSLQCPFYTTVNIVIQLLNLVCYIPGVFGMLGTW